MTAPPPTASHVLILGSAPVDPDLLALRAGSAGALICADGGAAAALTGGLRPDLVVGDMDSISAAMHQRLVTEGVRLVQHPAEKDQTDLELAIEHALLYAPSRITILGALGGVRLDHTVGNLLLLAQPSLQELDVRLETVTNEAVAVWQAREIAGVAGEYVSLMPLTPLAEGIHTTGLRYPLRGESLVQGFARGVSNELTADRATVRVASGCLLVIHERSQPVAHLP